MQRFELKRHVSRRLAFGRRVGAAVPSDEISIRVLLHPKDGHALADAVSAVCDPRRPSYGSFYTADEVRRLVAPGYQDLDAVLSWLHDSGLHTDEPVGARTVIRARGSVEKVSKMLDIPVGRYAFRGLSGARFGAERNPSIPAPLAAIVRGIAGLNDLPAARRSPPIPAPKRPVR
ncbi:MAG TPA: protease pro-enzyme activation domain-containing protein, partial [Thermoanaerobaculia bacterium]|nr:protease pro-enzyme activation domain-containing protein [Thermoanaerobaculia bacterium]